MKVCEAGAREHALGAQPAAGGSLGEVAGPWGVPAHLGGRRGRGVHHVEQGEMTLKPERELAFRGRSRGQSP